MEHRAVEQGLEVASLGEARRHNEDDDTYSERFGLLRRQLFVGSLLDSTPDDLVRLTTHFWLNRLTPLR